MSIFNQSTLINNIDCDILKERIGANVADVNQGQGAIRKQTEVVERFKSVVGFEHAGQCMPGIIEISIKVKMLAPHFDENEYMNAIEELDEHDYERGVSEDQF